MAKTKVNFSIDEELLKRIDDFAECNYTNRSSVIINSVTQYLNQQQVTKAIFDLSVSMRRIADNGSVSDADRKSLEEFEVIAKLLTSGK